MALWPLPSLALGIRGCMRLLSLLLSSPVFPDGVGSFGRSHFQFRHCARAGIWSWFSALVFCVLFAPMEPFTRPVASFLGGLHWVGAHGRLGSLPVSVLGLAGSACDVGQISASWALGRSFLPARVVGRGWLWPAPFLSRYVFGVWLLVTRVAVSETGGGSAGGLSAAVLVISRQEHHHPGVP